MSTLAETLAAHSAKLSQLTGAPEQQVQTLKAAEALAEIAKELQRGELTKERADVIVAALAELQKNNWEATSWTPIKEVNDPTQLKPKTERAPTIQQLTTGKPDSHFATNLTTAQKAQLIHKLLTDPQQAIAKGVYSDKLEEMMKMFGLTEDDLDDEYDLRWKVGDLLTQLYRASQLENLVSKSAPGKAASPEAPVAKSAAWPLDMASAKYDPVAKSYQKPELTWGRDSDRS